MCCFEWKKGEKKKRDQNKETETQEENEKEPSEQKGTETLCQSCDAFHVFLGIWSYVGYTPISGWRKY